MRACSVTWSGTEARPRDAALARGPGKSCGNCQADGGGIPSAKSVLDFAPGFTRFRSSLSRPQTPVGLSVSLTLPACPIALERVCCARRANCRSELLCYNFLSSPARGTAGAWNFGLCATRSREPRQARKGATVPGLPRVPQITRSSSRRKEVISDQRSVSTRISNSFADDV